MTNDLTPCSNEPDDVYCRAVAYALKTRRSRSQAEMLAGMLADAVRAGLCVAAGVNAEGRTIYHSLVHKEPKT